MTRANRLRSPTAERARAALHFGLAALLGVAAAGESAASEREASHYIPGGPREFAVAVAPAAGLRLVAEARVDHGEHDVNLPGGPDIAVETVRALALLGGSYVFDFDVFGGRLESSVLMPFGHIEHAGPSRSTAQRFDIGDIEFTPLSWYWNRGRLHLNISEKIYAPTGGYDSQRLANLGRNYWSFDGILAATWFNDGSGTELSASTGIMANTENSETNYETGNEFHVEFAVTQYLVPNFAIGARGYYYNQVTEDRQDGLRLAGTEASAFGIGPAVLWSPDALGRKWTVVASWLRDLEAQRTLEDDHVRLTLTFTP